MSKFKRCLLSKKVPHMPAGSIINVWGHKWIVQRDHSAIGMIHQDFHKVEVKAGRYTVLPDQEKPADNHELKFFSSNKQTYYGCGSLESLKSKLSKLSKTALTDFAESRLTVKFPDSMGESAIVAEIINLVGLSDDDPDTIPEDAGIEEEPARRGRKAKKD